jgi:hypothetical protein
MLTGAGVMPKLVSLGRVGFRPTPFDWVPLAVIILLIGRDQECISLVQTPTPPLAGTLLSRTRRRATRPARP